MRGKPLVRVADLPSRAGVAKAAMLGIFSGNIMGTPGKFSIRVTPGNRIVGFFASDHLEHGSPSFTMDFSSGYFDEATGVLHLVNDNPRFGNVGGLVLVPDSANPDVLDGIYFNAFVYSNFKIARAVAQF